MGNAQSTQAPSDMTCGCFPNAAIRAKKDGKPKALSAKLKAVKSKVTKIFSRGKKTAQTAALTVDVEESDIHPLFISKVQRQAVPLNMREMDTNKELESMAAGMIMVSEGAHGVVKAQVPVALSDPQTMSTQPPDAMVPETSKVVTTSTTPPPGTFMPEMHVEESIVMKMEVNGNETVFPSLTKFDQKSFVSEVSDGASEADTVRSRALSTSSSFSTTNPAGVNKTSMVAMAAVNGINPINLGFLKTVAQNSASFDHSKETLVL